MQDTRQQILEILNRRGEVTVQELSQELRLTSVTVRHHLEILRAEGYITDPEIHRSNTPGRPRYVYHLTSTAADLFPNNYSGLATALLKALENRATPQERDALLRDTATQLAAGLPPLPDEPTQRMETLVEQLTQLGFVTRWEPGDNAHQSILYVSNCPYHYVAQHVPDICNLDHYMLSNLLKDNQLERLECKAHAGALCRYRITFTPPA